LKNIGDGGDVFAAMKFSARLPYRPGVSKSIILVTCSHGDDGSFYGDGMTMLTEQVIWKLELFDSQKIENTF